MPSIFTRRTTWKYSSVPSTPATYDEDLCCTRQENYTTILGEKRISVWTKRGRWIREVGRFSTFAASLCRTWLCRDVLNALVVPGNWTMQLCSRATVSSASAETCTYHTQAYSGDQQIPVRNVVRRFSCDPPFLIVQSNRREPLSKG